jgi:hypothetical protein
MIQLPPEYMPKDLFPKNPDFRRCKGYLCKPGTPAASGVDCCSDACARDLDKRRQEELYRAEADRRGHA